MDIRYCGLLAPRVYKSEGKKMSVIFKSDNTISETGFTAHWTAGKFDNIKQRWEKYGFKAHTI